MSLKSHKFSHRLFIQYFISAIIPVLVLVLLTFFSVSSLLDKNATRQIYAESRAVGLTLFDRLSYLETNLVSLAEQYSRTESIENDLRLKKLFLSIYYHDSNGPNNLLLGEKVFDFNLNKKQREHLTNNKSLLLNINENSQSNFFLMLSPITTDQDNYLVAVLKPDYLWNITIKDADTYCAVLTGNRIAHCSDNLQIFVSKLLNEQENKIGKTNALLEMDTTNNRLIGNAWSLFTEAQFGLNEISILYFMPKSEALIDYTNFIKTFPIYVVIVLLCVVFLSSVQMRRSLTPLVKLTQATKDVIAGDYTKPVEIKSNDEFEKLATTFNDMSQRISEQIKKIKTLAKIDRLILSTPDSDYIVEVLIEYIPTIMPADNVLIAVLSTESLYEGVLIYNDDESFKSIKKINFLIDESDLIEIKSAESILRKTDLANNSYLDPLVRLGNKSFLACPIRNQDELLGLICLGLSVNKKFEYDAIDSLLEIADRAAVALSNANWEKKLSHQAHYDALTKLPNRYLFRDRLEQAMERAKRNGLNAAVLFIDLDRFKTVNDSLGHVVGDKLLVEVANVLLKCIRSSDSVARFGGDEFTVVISDLNGEEVEEKTSNLAGRIIEMMSLPIIINGREFYISPSIGIAVYPYDADNFNDLLKNADTAMYEAKGISQGNYQFYKKKQNKETLAKLELENDLRHALEKGQFELYYQPKINLRNCIIYDVEALIRWKHPERGMISPGLFIPLAEETGLITNIGYWVMRTACKQNKVWSEKGIDLNIAVNVSADQFRQPDFYEKIIGILDETGVDPKTIELEITESITIENFDKTITLLNKLREYGLEICIDDFGTGYSSMTYLQKIPFNKLKIDKSFIDNIHLNNDSASITRAIVALAHNLSLIVVAEGVETKAQYDYLNAIDCDQAQGFFLSRPLPEGELIQHILMYNSRSANIN